MSYIFDGCLELKNINSINNWNIENVKNKTDALRGTNLPEDVKQKWRDSFGMSKGFQKVSDLYKYFYS